MPHVVVYNLNPDDFEDAKIEKIEAALSEAFRATPELNLRGTNTSFSFPKDPTIGSGNVPIFIIVEILFEKPARTLEVRRRLAKNLGCRFVAVMNEWRRVPDLKVAVKRFDPEKDGFWDFGTNSHTL
ncbi:MAG: hypothetical protein HYW91_02070 [Candidatus Sungbacteria bacterium]|nr:hypothetical protein [Candidatus Sungbacteria bacterium]